jgi:hypothetical protein
MIFSLYNDACRLCHIYDFIARLVDGFNIEVTDNPIYNPAAVFATAFARPVYAKEDVMNALHKGGQEGLDTMRYLTTPSPFGHSLNSAAARQSRSPTSSRARPQPTLLHCPWRGCFNNAMPHIIAVPHLIALVRANWQREEPPLTAADTLRVRQLYSPSLLDPSTTRLNSFMCTPSAHDILQHGQRAPARPRS